jgi:hypothetical protein
MLKPETKPILSGVPPRMTALVPNKASIRQEKEEVTDPIALLIANS